MTDNKLTKTVQTTFSMFGLVLSSNLSATLAKQLLQVSVAERNELIIKIAEYVLAQNLKDPHVDIQHIKCAIEECFRPDTLREAETVLNVINALDFPKVEYDICKNKFVVKKVSPDLYSEPTNRTLLFKNRFDLLWHRTQRHASFVAPKFGKTNTDRLELIPIEYLLSDTRIGCVCVMGVLVQLADNQYYLEDSGGYVKLDLQEADSLVMEGSIIIINGIYEDKVLKVHDIYFPPAELSNNSCADFGNSNTFGGPSAVSLKMSEKLKVYEESNENGMIVFLSELWVDNTSVLAKFQIMLDGYSDFPPVAFVLCGNFLSFPLNITSAQKMKEGFKNLAEIITKYPTVYGSSKFIFVPALDDLGSPKILPRAPLPKFVTQEFTTLIPNSIFASNPCRIQYCTKEIVVLREDILTKMCRNTIHFPTEGFAKSIICQSHLTPLSLPVIPVYWKHDYALQVFPTPDVIVVADNFEAYSTNYSNCHVINPGTFPKNNYSFKVYQASLDTIEDCEIPNDENT